MPGSNTVEAARTLPAKTAAIIEAVAILLYHQTRLYDAGEQQGKTIAIFTPPEYAYIRG